MDEVYVSTDVETDGPIPGPNSMLSFGSAAFIVEGSSYKFIDTFSANLVVLPGSSPNPETEAWWKTQPEAWKACRENQREPMEAMVDYVGWLKKLPGRPVFVGYPAGFDFLFLYWYLINFAKESPFGFSALDIKSYACAMMGSPFRETTKKKFPKRWFGETRHNHVAIDDATEQGEIFMRMLLENKSK